MTSIGRQTGLFEAMAALPPSTSEAIAGAAGLDERYVREWLGAMVTGGIVEFDAAQRTYVPARGARGGPHPGRRRAQPGQVHAVHPDAGRGRGGRDPQLPERRRRALFPVPALPGLDGGEQRPPLRPSPAAEGRAPHRPRRRARRAGSTCSTSGAARAMPSTCSRGPSRAADSPATTSRRRGSRPREAEAEALGNANVRFEARDVAALGEMERYDLVTAFDVIHDQARPHDVLREVSRALRHGRHLPHGGRPRLQRSPGQRRPSPGPVPLRDVHHALHDGVAGLQRSGAGNGMGRAEGARHAAGSRASRPSTSTASAPTIPSTTTTSRGSPRDRTLQGG